MSDYISRKSMLRHFGDWQMELAKVGNEREYNLLEMIIRGVENEPTAFDLESVIEQLEAKRAEAYAYESDCWERANKTYNEDEKNDLYEGAMEWRSSKDACDTALKIIKSAANATNGKSGG